MREALEKVHTVEDLLPIMKVSAPSKSRRVLSGQSGAAALSRRAPCSLTLRCKCFKTYHCAA